MSIDRYFALRSITGCAISPDGKLIAYAVERLDPNEDTDGADLFLVRAGPGARPERITSRPGLRASPAWSPDGSLLAYKLKVGGRIRLALWHRGSGREEVASPPDLDLIRFEWAPDSRRVALVAEAAQQDSGLQPVVQSRPPVPQELFVLDVPRRAVTRYAAAAGSVDYVSWSPDGAALALSARPVRTAHDLMYRTRILTLELASRTLTTLVDRPGLNSWPKWSPDGTWIAFLSTGGRADYLGATHACIVAAHGGSVRDLTPQFDERIIPVTTPFLEWDRDSRSVLFALPRGVVRTLYRVMIAGDGAVALTPSDRVYSDFSLARDRDRMALLVSDPVTPWELFVSPVSTFAPERVATANPRLDRSMFGTTRVFEWRTSDGQLLQGLLISPPGYDSTRAYPMLTYLHGGPSSEFTLSFSPQVPVADVAQVEPLAPQIFPSRGYLVFLPNPRGSGGYGQEFLRANVRHSPELEAEDAVSGVRFLVARGVADSNRLGIMGWSAGGEQAAWAISHSDLFRAAIIGAGTVDETAEFGGQYHPDLMLAYMIEPPWDAPEEYVAHSSIYAARRIHTPTLIINGANDDAVPPIEGKELFRALSDLGVPAEQLIYPGQGHNFSDPRSMRDVVARTAQWLARWLDRPVSGTGRTP